MKIKIFLGVPKRKKNFDQGFKILVRLRNCGGKTAKVASPAACLAKSPTAFNAARRVGLLAGRPVQSDAAGRSPQPCVHAAWTPRPSDCRSRASGRRVDAHPQGLQVRPAALDWRCVRRTVRSSSRPSGRVGLTVGRRQADAPSARPGVGPLSVGRRLARGPTRRPTVCPRNSVRLHFRK